MNLERLRWGDWIAAIAGLELILVTFRAWYKVAGTGGYVTAWDALEQGRYLLIATGVVGILLLLLKSAESEMTFPPGWLAAVVGFACTVYVAYRLATPPADTLDAASGIYLGLLGALGVTIGGLLSARDDAIVAPSDSSIADMPAPEPSSGYSPPAAVGSWSPAPPAASSSGWSPAAAAPAAAMPSATAAGAAGEGERPLRSGEEVVLTAGSARFPAGTVGVVVEAFGGGALVEVKAPDGVGERFEVPDSAFERVPAGRAAPPPGENWSPAMPEPSNEDWGFDEPGAGASAAVEENGASPDALAPAEKKVPWWKRDIGGGGKKKAEEAAAVGAVGAVAAGAALATSDKHDDEGEQKPSLFKRMFGGGSKSEPETGVLEGESTPASDIAGVGSAAESDTAIGEPAAEAPSAVDEPATTPQTEADPEDVAGSSLIAAEPDPTAVDPEPVPPVKPEAEAAPDPVTAVEPDADAPAAVAPEVPAPLPDPEPEPPAPVPEPEAAAPVVEPESPAPEPEAATPVIEPETPAPEPEPEPDPEPASAPEPEAAAAGAAGAAAAGAAARSGDEAEAEPTPKRKRSSGTRKVPREAIVTGADDAPPKVGDEVQLKVGGGKFDAGTRGTVVDVFSAGVIVELSDDDGRTERLDLPFEAIGPADK